MEFLHATHCKNNIHNFIKHIASFVGNAVQNKKNTGYRSIYTTVVVDLVRGTLFEGIDTLYC